MEETALIVGIDLGTTHSAIGMIDTGFPVLIPDQQGNRLTPSVVALSGSGKHLVGTAAQHLLAREPESTISSIKRLIGRRHQELSSRDLEGMTYALTGDADGWCVIATPLGPVSPVEVSAAILEKLVADVEAYCGRKPQQAVISVPAYFNETQRQKTKEAAVMAGLEVRRMISEPTAAALAYGFTRERKAARLAVFDLGGGTFDLSIVHLNDGVFDVVATQGNTRLGGDDMDRIIADALRRQAMDISPDLAESPSWERRCLIEARKLKHALTESETAEWEIRVGDEGRAYQGSLSRDELERLVRPVLEPTRGCCQRALQDAGIRADDLDGILLVGGATRMPAVRSWVHEVFGKAPETHVHPDEAVALGATVQAGILSGQLRELLLLDVTPLSLGVETYGGLMNVIIPRNSSIPCKAGEIFTNAVDQQRAMQVTVLQGERELARDNWRLGDLEIEFDAAPRGKARVGVQFEIDADGLLHVLARDLNTGREKQVEVHSSVDVTDEKVERMVAESVDRAFEDMEARRRVEAVEKAKRVLEQAETALERAGDGLEAGQAKQVNAAMETLRFHLQEGTSREIRDDIEVLDRACLPLADILVERALEAASQKALDGT